MSLFRVSCLILPLTLGTHVRAQETPPPYEPQLMRLAEIMGALAWLRDLCGAQDGAAWRTRMEQLLDAEHPSAERRERLAGAFNRGFADYRRMQRACNAHSEAIMTRFLDEGARITRDVSGRYGG